MLETVIIESLTWGDVCRRLGVKPATGAQTHLKNRAIFFEIDFSHFTGQSWSKGKSLNLKRPIENYLNLDGAFIGTHALKKRLIREGFKNHLCENCGLDSWLGHTIPIELHHKNGNRFDNRIENLEILCPNCHAVTDTYSGKNRK